MRASTLVTRSLLIGASLALVVGVVGFGVAQGAAIGTARGVVYRDANGNGVRDAGEPGVPGVVVSSPTTSTVTNASGNWSLRISGTQRLQVATGWYRSQCDSLTCAAGPGRDQDFAVSYQNIVAKAVASKNPLLDVGLIPDWPGGYPIPSTRPIPANAVDASARISFVKPAGPVGTSNCSRTSTPANRACAIGDRPQMLVQVFNEGTTKLSTITGHLQLPLGISLVSVAASTDPRNHPALGTMTLGPMDAGTRRIPFSIPGTLPPAGMAVYVATLRVDANAPLTTTFQTKGAYPNQVGLRLTGLTHDAEGDPCASNSPKCRWGTTDRQMVPDNSDTVGFAVVARPATAPPPSPTAPTTVASPSTTTPTLVTTTTSPSTIPVAATTTTTAVSIPSPDVTVAPPAVSTTVPAGCSVSTILVPSCGMWLGASTPNRSGGYDYTIGLGEYEAVAQNTPDILHFYKTGAVSFPTAQEAQMAERPGLQRSLLLYNWKPSKTLTWAQIAAGDADAAIATVAASLQRYPHQLFLDIFHEPEDNVRPAAGSGFTPDDYVAMYRHVVAAMRDAGVTNAVYVWNPMGYYGWRDYLDGLYPGDDVVDWVCFDPYVKDDAHTDLSTMINRDRPDLGWPGFYAWATAKAPGKPLMLCEWGVDLLTNTDPASVLAATDVDALATRYPMLKAWVYWNDVDRVDVRIDDPSPKGIAYGAAYRRFAAHPQFTAMAPDSAP